MMAHRHLPIGVARRLSLVPAGAGVRARSFSASARAAQVIGDSSDDLVSKAFLEELPRPAQAQASNGITSIPVDEAPGHGIEPLLELMTERVELRRVMSRPVHQGDFFGSRPPQRDDREGDLVSLHGRRPPVRSRPSVPLHDPVALPRLLGAARGEKRVPVPFFVRQREATVQELLAIAAAELEVVGPEIIGEEPADSADRGASQCRPHPGI